MKIHSKIGNRPGQPAYRTQATFRVRQYLKVKRASLPRTKKGR